MPDLTQRLEKLRNILVSDAFNRKKKVRVLHRVMELRDEPEVCALIREATRLPVNEPILADFVRALGYLGDPAVLEDLAGFLCHPRKLVARNAIKAAVSFDPERAVELVMRQARSAPLKNVSAAMKVLAERCPREAGPAVEKLVVSRSRRDRLLAVIFLTHVADVDSTGRLLDLLETERESAIVELAFQALDRQASQANRARIEGLLAGFAARAERLRALLNRLPDEPVRAPPPHTQSRRVLPLRSPPPPSSADSRPELLRAERDSVAPGPSSPSAPDAADSLPATKLLPWQEKEQKIKARRSRGDRTGLFATRKRRRAWQAVAAVLLVAGTAGVTWLAATHRPVQRATAHRVVDATTSPLGAVNAKVKFSGTIAEVHADYNTLLVRAKEGTLASVRFKESIASFAPGHAVEIAGTIREIHGGKVCVLDGITARQP